MNKVECRGNEIHLWDCPLSLKNHTDCSHKEHAGLTCADLSLSTTPATATSASPPVSPPVRSILVSPPQTPPAASLSVTPVLVIVLVVVLLLLLVPLLILIQQNRVMRRALSNRRRRTANQAVYEEIQHRPSNRHSLFTQRVLFNLLLQTTEFLTENHRAAERVNEITREYYEDVITDLDRETVDTPENYDDVIINRQASQGVTGESEGDQGEYDDVKNSSEDERNLLDWFGEGGGEIRADVFDCDGNETNLSECSISSWSRAKYSHIGDVGVICSSSSLALHDGLVRLSGERQCEGEVEVFIHQVWRRVLLDSWSLTESSVVCRQLGCGSVLNFYDSSSSSPEHSHECVTGFQCSGSEAHLGNCSSPQTLNCSSTQQLSITCLDLSDSSAFTAPATTTSASPPVSPPMRSTSVSPSQTPPAVSLSVTSVLVIVLVVVLLLLLVPLLILIQQNRVMRRALSKRRHRTTTEAVYEEIQHKPTNRHSLFTQRGSLLSTEQHSGYEDANKLLSAKSAVVVTPDYCNDGTTTKGPTDDLPRNYDGVVIVKQLSNDKTDGVQEEYDDVVNVREHTSDMFDSSLALHDGLVRLSGERQCEGEVEVFIHQVWRRVLLDSWSLTESSVVCRQLGCGSVLNFYGSSSSSPEHSHECVTGFQCSGSEAHLGNCSSPQTLNCSSTQQLSITCLEFKEIRLTEGCEGNVEVFYNGSWGNLCYNMMDRDTCPSSPWGQNNCDNEVAKITCSNMSVSTTPATATSASPPVFPPVCSILVSPPQTPPAASLSVTSVLVIVLVVVLLLLLVPLLILIQQNRVMRRALADWYTGLHRTRSQTEPVYEEIYHRHNQCTHRGSLISEDAAELLTEDRVNEITPAIYEDIFTGGLIPDRETDHTPEGYYDVIASGQNYGTEKGDFILI
ncbi:scavenger receptor cysteine-rich type 1 M130-like protein [Labeo rohita]|uniref:Scavenger receptor cysteine-rich type 1 M130-like protein n=1 Tax=Labeo rohita TaxID=84645 RepID=A0A498L9X6_LABRO|nr:scavenger receptor cysteine-rich type 1 M130-like protein [Labeo rohita]